MLANALPLQHSQNVWEAHGAGSAGLGWAGVVPAQWVNSLITQIRHTKEPLNVDHLLEQLIVSQNGISRLMEAREASVVNHQVLKWLMFHVWNGNLVSGTQHQPERQNPNHCSICDIGRAICLQQSQHTVFGDD